MKLIVDVADTFGELIFLNCMLWKDFDTKKDKGVKLVLGAKNTFEKIEVRVLNGKIEDFRNWKVHSVFKIDKLVANFWNYNNRSGITFSVSEEKLSPLSLDFKIKKSKESSHEVRT